MKPRLVGAVIILAIASIALPVLFQNPVKYPDVPDFVIPPEPAMPELLPAKVPEQYETLKKRIAENSMEPQVDNSAELGHDNQNADKGLTFTLDADKLPVAWSIRLATFKNYDNASALRKKLREADFKVYTRRSSNSSGDWVQVLVGPVLDRAEVEKLKLELSKRYKLDGVVTRYMR